MNAVALSEYLSAAFTGIALLGESKYLKKSKGARWLTVTLFSMLLYLVVDATTYAFDGASLPFVLRYIIGFLAYTVGGLIILFFTKYSEVFFSERLEVKQWIFRIPEILLIVNTGISAVFYVLGKFELFDEGFKTVEGGYQVWLQIIRIIAILFTPVYAIIKHKSIGIKVTVLLNIYCFSPIIGSVIYTLTEYDATGVLGAIALIWVTMVLQNDIFNSESEKVKTVQDIANQYAKTYEAVMIADLKTGYFGTVSEEDGIVRKSSQISFSDAILKSVLDYVHESDRQKLIDGVGDFEKIRNEYAVGESRNIEYRSINGNDYIWYCITLNRINDGELLIALRKCNDDINTRIVDDKLLDKYDAIYVVDLNHNMASTARSSRVSKVGDFFGTENYSEKILEFAETVAPQYKEDWINFSNPEYMKEYMADLDMREYTYELPTIHNSLRRLTIDVVERINGVASTLLFSFGGIDELSAKAMVLQKQVSEQQEQLQEALTFTNFFLNTYVSAYYVDLDTRVWQVYKRTKELDENYPIIGDYFESLTDYINNDVHPEDRPLLLEAVRPENMKRELEERNEYSHLFRDVSGGFEKIYRMQVIRGSEGNHAAFGFIDITDEVNEQNDMLRENDEARKLIESVAATYDVAFAVNMANNSYKILKNMGSMPNDPQPFRNFGESIEAFIGMVHDGDKNRMRHELEYDVIREKLKECNAYSTEFRVLINGVTSYHEMVVTRIDEEQVALGFSDRDLEITRRNLDDKRFEEYVALAVVDIYTGKLKVLKSDERFRSTPDNVNVPYTPFILDIANRLENEPKEFYTQISDLEYVKNELARDNKRTYSYKMKLEEENTWIDVNLDCISRNDDGTPSMFTLGVSIVDALAAEKREILSRATENMQMISGLADEYDALYYINLDEEILHVYTLNEEKYPDSEKLFEGDQDIFEIVKGYGMSEHIHPDDRHLFSDFGADMIRKKLKNQKKYSMQFRVNTENGYRWDEMDIVKFEDIDDVAGVVVVGFADRDTEIRSEQALNRSFDVLGLELPVEVAVNRLLSIAGDFYGADRSYVFEYTKAIGLINNTYEWCATGVEPMIEKLQNLPLDVVEGWNKEFRRQGAFYMDALDSKHNTEETVALLEMQGIDSLVAAPLMKGDEIIGFIGIDNPTKAKTDTDILKKVATVVYSEILRRKENDEEQVTLEKLTDAFLSVYYTDLDTDYMRTWKIDEQYKDAYGSVQNYSVSMGGYVRNNIAERERERCIGMTKPEYILEQFETKDRFSIDMTDIMLGYERNIVFDFIKVNENGSRFVLCCRDVTESLAKEKEQQTVLQEALYAADAANKSKTDFLFNMSHDIRTPMNAIAGFTNMAVKHIDDREKVLDCLDKTQKAGMMLLSLINSILEVSRIESGNATLDEQPGDVLYSFSNLESTMREMAEVKDIDLTFEFGDITDRYVYVDFSRCMRVFVNVISNAIKYTKEGGYVKVRCEQSGKAKKGVATYKYTIADNGIGMSEEFQKHVFEQFAREQTATVSGIQGTGLGMTVVKSFVELMGGSVSLESKQGEGSTFTIILPFRLQDGESYTDPVTGEIVSADYVPKHADEINFAGKKVLLVEDNELNREIAIEILEDEGLVVEDADDGTTAVEKMKEKGPDYYDFILMDIQMPIMNGYEATKVIREMYPDAKVPIIALSANAFAEDMKKSLDAGMDDHVAKPISMKELFSALARHL